MRGTVKGVIAGMNEVLIQFDDRFDIERGDVVEVKIPKEKRTKNANALYWTLNERLAKKLDVSAEAIYREHIKGMSNYKCLFMVTDAVQSFGEMWCSGHLGRFIDTRESKEQNRTIVLAYYGSSDFDKAQMARLIDHCIQDCEANGVETYNQKEIDKAVAAWRA